MRRLINLFTLIFLAFLAFDVYPGLRGGGGWQWAYADPQNWISIIALAVCLGVYLLGVYALRRYANTVIWANLLWSFLGASILAIAVVGIQGDVGFQLFTRTVSPVQTGASTVAVQIMARDDFQSTLDNWTEVMQSATDANIIHFSTSPPGQAIFHYSLAQFFQDIPLSEQISMGLRPYQCSNPDIMNYTRGEMVSAGLGLLMPFFAALTVLPLYSIGRQLTNTSATALYLTHWWALIPAVLMFMPTWNTVYPFLTLTSFALLLTGIRTRNQLGIALFCGLAGIVMSITTFLNFAVLPILLFMGLFTLGYTFFVQQSPSSFIRSGVKAICIGFYFGLGLLSIWLLFYLSTGVSPIDMWNVTLSEHNELVQREYLPWLILHPYDVLMFIGWSVAGLFIWAIWRVIRTVRQTHQVDTTQLVVLTMGLTFLLVNLSGMVQGENARILSFYAPFILIGGLLFMQKSRWWDMSLLATQAVMVLVMASVLPVVPLDLNPMPIAPRQDLPSFDFLELVPITTTFSSDAYNGEFSLESHRFIADLAEQTITVELQWRGQARTERPYHFQMIAYAENSIDGQIESEPLLWYPQNGNYLTTCWREGDLIRDIVILPLPLISEPVIWRVEISAIDERTGDIAGTATLAPVNYP